jgi:hypothetical protein
MGFEHRLIVFLEWVLSFVGHGREARLITQEDWRSTGGTRHD